MAGNCTSTTSCRGIRPNQLTTTASTPLKSMRCHSLQATASQLCLRVQEEVQGSQQGGATNSCSQEEALVTPACSSSSSSDGSTHHCSVSRVPCPTCAVLLAAAACPPASRYKRPSPTQPAACTHSLVKLPIILSSLHGRHASAHGFWIVVLGLGFCGPEPASRHQHNSSSAGEGSGPHSPIAAAHCHRQHLMLHSLSIPSKHPTCVLALGTQDSGSCWGVCQMLLCRRRCTHLQMTAHRNAASVYIVSVVGGRWWQGKVAAAPHCPHGVHEPSVPAVPGCRQHKALQPACSQADAAANKPLHTQGWPNWC